MNTTLPTGRPGQALALGLLGGALLLAWFAVAAPLLAWHVGRAEQLADRLLLARRLEAAAMTLPSLQAAASTAAIGNTAPALLEGATDATTGAALQGLVQDMAARMGATLFSVETLATIPVGAYRRVGLRLSLTAPWPVLVELLQAVDQARPRMVVDDLELHNSQIRGGAEQLLLNAAFSVHAFSAHTVGGPTGNPGSEPRAVQ